jgi:CRISPR-associated protein (TIGR02710 family)
MKKAMIITVGVGRNGQDIAHGIAYSIRSQNPNFILFVGSELSIEQTLKYILQFIDLTAEQYIVKTDNEVNDVEKLYRLYSTYIEELIDKNFSVRQIVADYTSGTKAMSAALVSAAFAKRIETISYVYGERKDGTVVSGTERSNLLSPTFVYTDQTLLLFRELFNRFQYDSALQLFDLLVPHVSYQEKIDTYSALAKAYSAWDKFNFGKAFEHLDEIDIKKNRVLSVTQLKQVNLQRAHLYKIKDDNIVSVEKIMDLMANSYRRYLEGKYDDGVARLYRTIEMIGQNEFYNKFACVTKDVPIEKLPEGVLEKLRNKPDDQTIDLALYDTFTVLDFANNNSGKIWMENLSDIKKILGSRNNSILAHGMIPIKKETYEKFHQYIIDLFKIEAQIEFLQL